MASAKKRDGTWSVAPLWRMERSAPGQGLVGDITCDTAVVGAGITGLCAAEAVCPRQKVVVVDAQAIGEGSSGWSAGILSTATTLDLREVEAALGENKARDLVAQYCRALLRIKEASALGCQHWQTGSALCLAARGSHRRIVAADQDIRAKYELPSHLVERSEIQRFYPGTQAAISISGEHAVHPVMLMTELAQRIERSGGTIFEHSPAQQWRHDGKQFIVDCRQGRISCRHLVICTGHGRLPFPGTERIYRACVPVTSHILVTEPSAEFAEHLIKTAQIALWDTLLLYHYVRYLPDGRVLVGGEDEPGLAANAPVEPTAPQIERLYRWACRLHRLKLPAVEYAWRGTLAVPADGLPFVQARRFGDSILIMAVTDGLPFAFLLGEVVAAYLDGGEHPLGAVLGETRAKPAAARLLAALPPRSIWRNAACRLAFTLMHLKDRLG